MRLCLKRVFELREEPVRAASLELLRACCALDAAAGVPWGLLLRAALIPEGKNSSAERVEEEEEAVLEEAVEAAAGLLFCTGRGASRAVRMHEEVRRCLLRTELPPGCPSGLLGALLLRFNGGKPGKTELWETHEWLPSTLALLDREAEEGGEEEEEPRDGAPGERPSVCACA